MFGLLLLGVNFVYYGLKGSIFDEIDDLRIYRKKLISQIYSFKCYDDFCKKQIENRALEFYNSPIWSFEISTASKSKMISRQLG